MNEVFAPHAAVAVEADVPLPESGLLHEAAAVHPARALHVAAHREVSHGSLPGHDGNHARDVAEVLQLPVLVSADGDLHGGHDPLHGAVLHLKGAADEVKDMTSPMSNLRWVCEWANVCIFTIHHQRKSNGTKGREGETLRGHSSIEAAIDVALLVDRGENGSLAVDLRATKERGATFPERSATFSYTWHPGTHELETARFWGIEAQQRNNPRAQEESDIEDAIMDALTMNSALNMTALAKETGYSRDKLRPVLTKLVNSARIAERQGRT